MKFVLVIIMFVMSACFQVAHFHNPVTPDKNKVKNYPINPLEHYYLLLKMPSKKRRYSDEAHFFVGRPHESSLDMEELLNIYTLLNHTEKGSLIRWDTKVAVDKKLADIANLSKMYKLKESTMPDDSSYYIIGTPRVHWISNNEIVERRDTTVNELASTKSSSINKTKVNKVCDHDIVIDKPYVSWITNELPIENKSLTTKP